jgi:hypothetical protein
MTKFNVTSIRKDVKEVERRDIVFTTDSDVGYTSKGEKFKSKIYYRNDVIKNSKELKLKLKNNFLFCRNNYWCSTWGIKEVRQEKETDSWLSMNQMLITETGRICDLIELIQKNKTLIKNYAMANLFGYWDKKLIEGVDMFLEIRIYKNRTINVVLEIDWDSDKKVFFCLKKETAEFIKSFRERKPLIPNFKQHEEVKDYISRVESDPNYLKANAWVLCFSDEEVKKMAFNDSVKTRFIERSFGVWGGDLDLNFVTSTSDRWEQVKFSPRTKELIHEFFGYNKESNERLKNTFNAKYLRTLDGYVSRNTDEGICTLGFLECYLITKAVTPKKKEIEEDEKSIEEIWDDFLQKLEDNDLSLHEGRDELAWSRQGRYIVEAYWQNKLSEEERSWRNSYDEASVFIYDVKKKKRQFARIQKRTKAIDSRIPSLNNQILKYMKISKKNKWDPFSKKYCYDVTTEAHYLDNLTPREMFDGTNVAWIIDNKDQIGFNPLCVLPSDGWNNQKSIISSIISSIIVSIHIIFEKVFIIIINCHTF